jgi:hypothetical protein
MGIAHSGLLRVLVVAGSTSEKGDVTEDAGESWRKIAREFGEVRTGAWLPA